MGIARTEGSVRDIKEGHASSQFDPPEMVSPPHWLSPEATAEFENLVEYLTAAQVPVKQADTYAISMVAQCLSNVAAWTIREREAATMTDRIECAKLVARFQRDSQAWLFALGATPRSRAQIGIKSAKKQAGPLAELLAQKRATQ